ncbi:DUF4258 domain-containing protein [Bradyrhizobium sp.]|uniref:DUF4258 domain-containing protein n=1 Tax=Bradyrhizobium sp. TaxID=376 RepID=UPI0026047984|nr:DUF4258 domain-containing protein [Bradyrhizobium sp.]
MSEEDQPPIPLKPALAPAPRVSRIPAPQANVVSLVPRAETVGELVRKLAADTTKIKWSAHAFERMSERGITDKTALEVMRKGSPKGKVEAGRERGEWKIKMAYRPNGRREVGVVVITVRTERLLVKTVEWEDVT